MDNNELLDIMTTRSSGNDALKHTIETLMTMQDEDRLALFTVISIAVAHLNGYEMSEDDINRQRIIINNVLTEYEIFSNTILVEKTAEVAKNLMNKGLIRQPPLGGVQ